MKKFIIKVLILTLLCILLMFCTIIAIGGRFDTANLPGNNVSNSSSCRAKMDHAISGDYLKSCTFLISGSSMSLNNISGRTIQEETGEDVYNVSSFGAKPIHTRGLFEAMIKSGKIRYLLVGFNNCDFGNSSFNIDFKKADAFLNGSSMNRLMIFFETFNLRTFCSDLNDRTRYSDTDCSYKSLKFDDTGSIMLRREGFEINNERWNEPLPDSTGFHDFLVNVESIDSMCEKNEIRFLLVYLPSRSDLMSQELQSQNKSISEVLEERFGGNFVNLSRLNISDSCYCDGTHLFREGAVYITRAFLDSLGMGNKCDFVNMTEE